MSEKRKIEEEISKLYAQINTLNSIAEALKNQSETIQKQLIDMQLSIDTINEISKMEKGHKVLLPLGSSILIDAIVADNENSYINVGANVIIKKSNNDVKTILENRMENLQRQQLEVQKRLNETLNSIEYLQGQLNTLIQQASEKKG
ncbi:MAG: prefoldin subunit alpha [Candidatus Methanomethylicia archaeon]